MGGNVWTNWPWCDSRFHDEREQFQHLRIAIWIWRNPERQHRVGRHREVAVVRVVYLPQRTDAHIIYAFDDERVTATINGATDVFSFANLPDGEVAEIISALDPCPVLAARRVDGELHVILLRAIPARPQPSEYETPEDYEAALDAWRRLWTDDLEVVIGG